MGMCLGELHEGGDLAISEFQKGASGCAVNRQGGTHLGAGRPEPGERQAGMGSWQQGWHGGGVHLCVQGWPREVPGWGYGQGLYRAGACSGWLSAGHVVTEGHLLGQMPPEARLIDGTEKAAAVLQKPWALGQEGADRA